MNSDESNMLAMSMLESYSTCIASEHGNESIETMVVRIGHPIVEVARVPWPLLVLDLESWIKDLPLEIQIASVRTDNRGKGKIPDLVPIVGEQLIASVTNQVDNKLNGYRKLALRASIRPWALRVADFGKYLDAMLLKSSTT